MLASSAIVIGVLANISVSGMNPMSSKLRTGVWLLSCTDSTHGATRTVFTVHCTCVPAVATMRACG